MACDHQGCPCEDEHVEENGKRFCSEFCANAETADAHEPGCRCGHPDCAAA